VEQRVDKQSLQGKCFAKFASQAEQRTTSPQLANTLKPTQTDKKHKQINEKNHTTKYCINALQLAKANTINHLRSVETVD
jgi:hypothetical protein